MKHMKEALATKSVKLKVRDEVTLWKLTFCKKHEKKQVCFWVYDKANELIKLNEETFALFKSWVKIRKDFINKSKQYKIQTIEVITYIKYYQKRLQETSRLNWADMIDFNTMLLIQKDILTFKLYKQLEELIRITQRIKKLNDWKHHVRSLQIYCRFDRLSTARIFRIFYDNIDSKISNNVFLKTLRERDKEFKEEASLKKIWVSKN